MKRGQISVEYLIVVGFVVFAVISLLGIAFFYASSIQDRIKSNQLEGFANKIIFSAESVYFAGEPSKVTVTAYLPKGVQNIYVLEETEQFFVVFEIATAGGVSTIAYRSSVPLNAGTAITTSEGVKRLEIQAPTGAPNVSIIEG
jgi:uncharacterized protein (UPF0333 family)